MRVRNALLTTGVAVLMATAIGSPAQAASWTYIDDYGSKKACVDSGQQYEREGWSAYKCVLNQSFAYSLWIR